VKRRVGCLTAGWNGGGVENFINLLVGGPTTGTGWRGGGVVKVS